MVYELLAWMQMLALESPARRWEPKRLRLRVFSAASRLARSGRRLRLGIAPTWPWAPPDHRSDHPPASPRARLASITPPYPRKDKTKGPWNPAWAGHRGSDSP